MLQSAEKCKKKGPLGFNNINSVAKKLKGELFPDIEKVSKKSRTMPKKIKKGDLLVSSGFVGYVREINNETGTLLH